MSVYLENHIAEKSTKTVSEFVPKYHAVPPTGWINDPNGFIWYKGCYHLFGQFYPYDSKWGTMHWGHWTSEDLVSWTWRGVALEPDTDADRDGCFSGTAIIRDNRLYLMYTGVRDAGNGKLIQQQCIAWSDDGFNFTKSSANPVISKEMLPEGCSAYDFRDPKIIEMNGRYWSIITNMGNNGGQLLVFESDDLTHWTFKVRMIDGMAVMPECVDVFQLAGTDMVVLSLIGTEKDGIHYPHARPAVLLYGRLNHETAEFIESGREILDHGFDFYAPQTIEAPDGRRLVVGWMQQWDRPIPTDYLGHGWSGCMTLIRELQWTNQKLIQLPVSELYRYCNRIIEDEFSIVPGRSVVVETPSASCISIRAAMEQDTMLNLSFSDGERNWLTMKCSDSSIETDVSGAEYSTCPQDASSITVCPIEPGRGKLDLLMICDISSIEVFVNNGEQVITNRVYPGTSKRSLRIEASGHTVPVKLLIDEVRKEVDKS